jgi:hypothetical protein
MNENESDLPAELKAIVAPLVAQIKKDVIIFAGPLHPGPDRELVEKVRREKSSDDVLLLLATSGGAADSAYRVARCLQGHYHSFTLFVDSWCKSAGTLIALAADEIAMSDTAELGPLDVQLSKPDELMEWTSGLTPIQALSTLRQQAFESFEDYFLKMRYRSGLQITTRTAFDIAAKLAIGLFSPVFEQLDPMRLGEIQRAMLIAHDYGLRLASRNLREDALKRLIAGYPSHGFIIDRREASELFHRVREPTEAESSLAQFTNSILECWDDDQGAFVGFFSHSPSVESTEEGKPGEQGHATDKETENAIDKTAPKRRHRRTAGDGESQPVGQHRIQPAKEDGNGAPVRTAKAKEDRA